MTDNVWLKVTIILGKEAGHKGRKPGAIQAIAEALGEYLRVKKDDESWASCPNLDCKSKQGEWLN